MGSPAGAQSVYDPNVDQREDYQQHRIQHGIHSGALGPGEARYLEREQARIEAVEDRLRADGRLSPRERQRLNHMQNLASRDIYRLDHNGRTAEGWGGGNHYGWGNGNHYGWGEHRHPGWNNHANHGWNGHRYAGWDNHHDGRWGGHHPYDPRYDRREDRQQHRIQHGIHSGALGPGEARYLERQQGHIQATEDRMRSDGRLSPRERQRLNHMQNRASRDIYRLDHNGRPTPGYTGNQAGWQGHNNGWNGRGYGWQGNNSGQNGNTATGTTPSGTTTPGNAQGWQGRHHGGNGYAPNSTPNTTTPTVTPPAGTTTAGTPQGWRGNQARSGPAGFSQQPAPQARSFSQPANWQGQPRFQQTRPQFTPNMARPHNNSMARQPGGFAGRVNGANFSPRRR
jgi:hypothetical protein